MIVTRMALPRRTFLRGAGASLALPLLDAMVPALTAFADTPASPARLRRLGYVYMPMGCDITRWTPPGGEELDQLSSALDRGVPIAVGSRATPASHIARSQSSLRVLFGRAGNLWIQALAVPQVRDTQCGFKLFEGPVARRLFALCRENRFGIDIEVLCLARRHLKLNVAEVGVVWSHQDGSKVRAKDYLDVLVKVPRIVWSVSRLRAPKR